MSKCLVDLKVDGLIFDHVGELRDGGVSTTENLFIGKQHLRKISTDRMRFFFFDLSAEEREELEVLNNIRQKQLELKHNQLLQELENLKSARQTNNLTDNQQLPIDSNFKSLM